MKNLNEKKLLVKMARAFGQPVDPALLESIEKEEKLAKILFKEEAPVEVETIKQPAAVEENTPPIKWAEGTTFLNRIPEPQVIVEQEQTVAQTNINPAEQDLIKQTMDALKGSKPAKVVDQPIAATLRDKELDVIRKSIADLVRKVGTLSWGGGGTGSVSIRDMSDFVRSTMQNGRYMKYENGYFFLDEINPYEVVHNTTEVTSNTYIITDSDYYIGVNYNGITNITLPADPTDGRTIIIKDESGLAQFNPIHIVGTIDNDAGGAIIKINNGAVQLLYRNGWRIV